MGSLWEALQVLPGKHILTFRQQLQLFMTLSCHLLQEYEQGHKALLTQN